MIAITNIWLILKTNTFKAPVVTNITFFDAFVLSTSIPSEISILLYPVELHSSIYMLLETRNS